MENLFYVGSSIDANTLGSYISLNPASQDFCKQNPYECKLGAQYDRLKVEISYLDEIYHSDYK